MLSGEATNTKAITPPMRLHNIMQFDAFTIKKNVADEERALHMT
jgi:hypothetical protein